MEWVAKNLCTAMNNNIIATAIEEDCHQLVRGLAIIQESIHCILMSKLEIKRACLAWVPHFLRMDKIQARFHICTETLKMITNEQEFLTRVITTNESCLLNQISEDEF